MRRSNHMIESMEIKIEQIKDERNPRLVIQMLLSGSTSAFQEMIKDDQWAWEQTACIGQWSCIIDRLSPSLSPLPWLPYYLPQTLAWPAKICLLQAIILKVPEYYVQWPVQCVQHLHFFSFDFTFIFSDINECNRAVLCEQVCVNTDGTYYCDCLEGYRLGNDSSTCIG